MKTAEQYLEDYEAFYISIDYEPLFASTQVEDAIKQAQLDIIKETMMRAKAELKNPQILDFTPRGLCVRLDNLEELMKGEIQ